MPESRWKKLAISKFRPLKLSALSDIAICSHEIPISSVLFNFIFLLPKNLISYLLPIQVNELVNSDFC
jgi:hypothetical protein